MPHQRIPMYYEEEPDAIIIDGSTGFYTYGWFFHQEIPGFPPMTIAHQLAILPMACSPREAIERFRQTDYSFLGKGRFELREYPPYHPESKP